MKMSPKWERSPECPYRRNMGDKLKELVFNQLTQEMESEGFIMLEWLMDTFALSKPEALQLFLSFIEERDDVRAEIIISLHDTEVIRKLLLTSAEDIAALAYHS